MLISENEIDVEEKSQHHIYAQRTLNDVDNGTDAQHQRRKSNFIFTLDIPFLQQQNRNTLFSFCC